MADTEHFCTKYISLLVNYIMQIFIWCRWVDAWNGTFI